MTINQCLTDGGLPDGWTNQNLVWLAQAHRHFSQKKNTTAHGVAIGWNGRTISLRSDWHRRWAAFIEDILETRDVPYH